MATDAGACLDEQMLADFVSRELDDGTQRGFEAHLVGCADRRGVVADALHGARKPGNLGNCVRHGLSTTREFPIRFSGYGPYTEVAGSNLNGLTLAN